MREERQSPGRRRPEEPTTGITWTMTAAWAVWCPEPDIRYPYIRTRSLPRPRRAASRPGEGFVAGIHRRAFDRTGSRIELPWPDLVVMSVGVGFPLFGFPRRVRLCPLAGPGFGHVLLAFQSCFGSSSPLPRVPHYTPTSAALASDKLQSCNLLAFRLRCSPAVSSSSREPAATASGAASRPGSIRRGRVRLVMYCLSSEARVHTPLRQAAPWAPLSALDHGNRDLVAAQGGDRPRRVVEHRQRFAVRTPRGSLEDLVESL